MKNIIGIKLKLVLLLAFLALSTQAFAERMSGDKGNGGTGTEAQLSGAEDEIRQIVLKIRRFFNKHQGVQTQFPDVDFEEFFKISHANALRIEVHNRELRDKDDKIRTCLNYPESNFVECNYSLLDEISSDPRAFFVLVFHELLGLMRVEVTSPDDPHYIEGYKISKHLAPYVSKTMNYDLVAPEDLPPAKGVTAEKELPEACEKMDGKGCNLHQVVVKFIQADASGTKPTRGFGAEYNYQVTECSNGLCLAAASFGVHVEALREFVRDNNDKLKQMWRANVGVHAAVGLLIAGLYVEDKYALGFRPLGIKLNMGNSKLPKLNYYGEADLRIAPKVFGMEDSFIKSFDVRANYSMGLKDTSNNAFNIGLGFSW